VRHGVLLLLPGIAVLVAVLVAVFVRARRRRPSSPVVEMLRAGEILLDPPCLTRDELIATLTAVLAVRAGRPDDAASFAALVREREALAGTGVGDGVAIPHGEVPGLGGPMLAFARLAAGVDFDAPDGERVRLVFLLLMPAREYDRQLEILSAMARLLIRPELRRGLLAARAPSEVVTLLDGAVRGAVRGQER
jgi:PTS system fructose-specific IIC component